MLTQYLILQYEKLHVINTFDVVRKVFKYSEAIELSGEYFPKF